MVRNFMKVLEVVALLLEKSVDLESGDLTPLCLAAESGHLEVPP